MKCTLCGHEMAPNDQFCTNCGTKISEMGRSFGSNPAPAYNAPGVNPGFGGNSFSAPITKAPGMNPALVKVIVAIIVVVVCVAWVGIRDTLTHTQDMGDFKATIPISCKKTDEQNKYSLGTSSDATAKSYGNGRMEFSYIKFDTSQGEYKGVADLVTESEFTNLMSISFSSSLSGYTEKANLGDTLRFTYTDDEGDRVYTEMKTVKANDSIYLLVCQCMDKNESRYKGKFTKFFSSVEFK